MCLQKVRNVVDGPIEMWLHVLQNLESGKGPSGFVSTNGVLMLTQINELLIYCKIRTTTKTDIIFLILIILTTDPVFRFHDEDYFITKLKRCNINGVT